MTSTHTPGPWEFEEIFDGDGDFFGIDINSEDGDNIAHIPDIGHTAYANAKLIAAAPELLAALQAIVKADFFPGAWNDHSESIAKKARAAIAKATS